MSSITIWHTFYSIHKTRFYNELVLYNKSILISVLLIIIEHVRIQRGDRGSGPPWTITSYMTPPLSKVGPPPPLENVGPLWILGKV